MATIRKRGCKYQAQMRRVGMPPVSRSFHILKDAQTWGRQMELRADRRDLPPDAKALQQITLGELVVRYRDTVTPRKRTASAQPAERQLYPRNKCTQIGAFNFGPLNMTSNFPIVELSPRCRAIL
jgi:hypothetical protein